MSKHTPGPWTVDSIGGDSPYFLAVNSPENTVAEVYRWDTFDEETGQFSDEDVDATAEANARLMSKAPEMYEKLREQMELLMSLDDARLQSSIDELDRFLAEVSS